jgi:adenosylmethionine-8-amino-7-oxononanoate aminotransferase
MCVAKGFTAGILPMAATLCSQRVFDGFLGDDDRTLYYGHTYCGHPLGAAVAREVLAVFRQERILELAQPKAARIAEAMARIGDLNGVEQPRALGMIGAVTLGGRAGYLERIGWRVSELARERGVYLRPLGNVVYVAPALNIEDADLNQLLHVVEESVALAVSGG